MEWKSFIAPHLVKDGIEKRMQKCKDRLQNATKKELKEWDIYHFNGEKWVKSPEFRKIAQTNFGLWGIDSKEKKDILLEKTLIVKKTINPMHRE